MIVVTGSSGLVGANLVRSLHNQGCEVRALIHQDYRGINGLSVNKVKADITDFTSLVKAFEGAETVYHLAGSISIRMDNWEKMKRINLDGTRNVINACLQSRVRKLIYFSSIHAYQQEPLDHPLDESRPLLKGENIPPYERSKAEAERLVRQAQRQGLETIIIIPTAILGPYDFRPSYIGEALSLLAQGRIPALVHGGYDWVDVRDVVDGAIQSEKIGKSGSRYILSGTWLSLMEVAKLTARFSGNPPPHLAIPIWIADLIQPMMAKLAKINGSQPIYTRSMLSAMRSNRKISHARATRDLGYQPRIFEETLRDTLIWLQDNFG